MLDDLNAGAMAGLTRAEIAARHPAEHAARARDRLRYRWPGLGGEGYVDLIVRLRPLIVELERTTDHLVLVTHRAIVRVLAAYFLGIERDGLGEVRMPRDAVYCFDVVSCILLACFVSLSLSLSLPHPIPCCITSLSSLPVCLITSCTRDGKQQLTTAPTGTVRHFLPVVHVRFRAGHLRAGPE